jgi:sulfopyruvate decarboxylase subunit alpha
MTGTDARADAPRSSKESSMAEELLGPRGVEIIAALKTARVEFVAALPDVWTSGGFLWPLAADRDLRLIRVCKEDEGVSICTGLAFCEKRSVLSMQYTGFLDSVNSLRGTAVNYSQPVCMLIGLLGKEPGVAPADSKRYDIRITQGILDVMGIDNVCIEDSADVAKVAPGIERAYANAKPFAALIGRTVRP